MLAPVTTQRSRSGSPPSNKSASAKDISAATAARALRGPRGQAGEILLTKAPQTAGRHLTHARPWLVERLIPDPVGVGKTVVGKYLRRARVVSDLRDGVSDTRHLARG